MGFTSKDGDLGASSSVVVDHEEDEHAADMDFQHEDLPEAHQDVGPSVGAENQEEGMQTMSPFERFIVNRLDSFAEN